MEEREKGLLGVLHLFSETGTEGGYWAFQDNTFIKQVAPDYGIFGGQVVWDQANPERKGKTLQDCEVFRKGKWFPLPDPMQKDPDYVISSLFCGEPRGDREADKRLMKKYGFKIQYVADYMDERFGKGNWHLENPHTAVAADGTRYLHGGTPRTKPNRPYGVGSGGVTRVTVEWKDGTVEQRLSNSLLVSSWSYEGLHILKDGDELIIYEKDDLSKVVWSGLIKLKQHDVFSQDAFGLWIHADQEGIDREKWATWFFAEYPARLMSIKK